MDGETGGQPTKGRKGKGEGKKKKGKGGEGEGIFLLRKLASIVEILLLNPFTPSSIQRGT